MAEASTMAARREASGQARRMRLKTERHPFQWVALDGERLVAGSWSKAIAWDFRHWLRSGNATAVSERGPLHVT